MTWLEGACDEVNATLQPLKSFVLPGGDGVRDSPDSCARPSWPASAGVVHVASIIWTLSPQRRASTRAEGGAGRCRRVIE
ncbi:MAG TPA: ATP:cob(I)alamin adenosyltransferase [Solirubrobacteraceae bacterium]|nr:ATP:cob(I)alamin adenosyltransferase [Solirubrobacteraceae bacterium]